MNRDLEETLNELGPEYRTVVARLRAGGEVESAGIIGGHRGPTAVWLTFNPWRIVAASLVLVAGLAVFFIQSNNRTIEQSINFSSAPREFRASVAEMIATQNPDGSWKNDFLTRRNAAALKSCGNPAAQIAYKKAVRNLRARGVL